MTTQNETRKWTIDATHYADDVAEPKCPFCGWSLSRAASNPPYRETYTCESDACPYAMQEPVREVTAALIEQGRDPLLAAQTAALYSMELDEEIDPVTAERFAVTDYGSADWVLKKLAYYQTKHDKLLALMDQEIARIQERGDAILQPIRRQLQFFEGAFRDQLAEFTRSEIDGQKTRSVKLLHGSLGFRRNPDSIEVTDETAATAMGESLPELAGVVRVVKSISKTAARRLLEALPDNHPFRTCVEIKPGEDVFYVKPESLEA